MAGVLLNRVRYNPHGGAGGQVPLVRIPFSFSRMNINRKVGDLPYFCLLHKRGKEMAGALLAVFSMALAAGCSQKAEVRALGGMVTYGGELLREGRVTLLSKEGKLATAPIQADGRYHLVNPPHGTVQAAVTTYPMAGGVTSPPAEPRAKGGKKAYSTVPPLPQVHLPARFADPTTSPLTFHIDPGDRVLDIHLPCLAGDPPIIKPSDLPKVGTNVGQEGPDIEGADLEGRWFQLSEYRGKVVVVLFWGHW